MKKPKCIYEPRGFRGRMMQQKEFEQLHRELLEFDRIEAVADDMRELIEDVWPELAHKLPPKEINEIHSALGDISPRYLRRGRAANPRFPDLCSARSVLRVPCLRNQYCERCCLVDGLASLLACLCG
jgi:hypothetical protein